MHATQSIGIAGMRDATSTTTTTGDGSGADKGGSAQYMSPEQYDPEDPCYSDSEEEEEEAFDAQVKSAGTAGKPQLRKGGLFACSPVRLFVRKQRARRGQCTSLIYHGKAF